MTSQRDRAELFHRLHADGVLVLPNAWDVASARLVEAAGARAVATTSGGVSWSLGTPDGDRLPRDAAVAAVARIAAAVPLPVSADVESGYGETPDELAGTVRAVVEAGAVGVNVEDGAAGSGGGAPLRDAAGQAARIAAVRAAADATGVRLYVNARTDVYLRGVGDPAGRLAETLRRAAAYVQAGADGIFVPGVLDPAVLRRLVAEVAVPLHVLAGPGAPPVAELAALGVRRVSVGTAIAEAAYGVVRRAAVELLSAGTYAALAGGVDYAELNGLLDRRPSRAD
jgi:2-methylisocitrate lyase-like PEP mutase family enzyme